jgi:ferredoxin-NADP reductase
MSNMSQQDHVWQVINRVKETPESFTYVFYPATASQKFTFTVGQFVTISALLKRPTATGNLDEGIVQRTYSIASSPNRDHIELTIKCEKPYGYIQPGANKSDGFAAYFFEQIKIGDKIHVKLNPNKDHFLSRIAAGMEKNIAYWSGANGAESARCLIQYMEDTKDPEFNLTLFYSNPALYASGVQHNNTVNIIYYDWLINMAKKMENLKIVFTFTREKELNVFSDHPRIVFRTGRLFSNSDGTKERTLSRYHRDSENSFNPICGSSGFINGIVRGPDGKVYRGRGVMQNLMDIEGIRPEKIDKEQFYLQSVGAHQ